MQSGESLETIQSIINMNDCENQNSRKGNTAEFPEFMTQSSSSTTVKVSPMQLFKSNRKRRRSGKSFSPSSSHHEPRLHKIEDLRQSFFTNTSLDLNMIKEFASISGFKKNDSFSTTITIQATTHDGHDVSIVTDCYGIVTSINYLPERWFSSTFIRHQKRNSDDVRICLETEYILERDGKLDSLRKAYFKKNIFKTNFVEYINTKYIDPDSLILKDPLVRDSCFLNMKLHNILIEKSISRYSNESADFLEYNEVHEGNFYSDQYVDWLDRRYEMQIQMATNRTARELCRSSYELTKKLFNYSKPLQDSQEFDEN